MKRGITIALVALFWGVWDVPAVGLADTVWASRTVELTLSRGEEPQASVRSEEIQAPRHRDSSPHPDEIQAPRTGEAA